LPFILGHKSFVQKDDGFNQNLPVFVYAGKYYRSLLKNIITNHTIPIYDFSVGMGGGIFTELDGYGILDLFLIPFAVITPAKYAAFGYTLMCIFKMFTGGIGYYIYLRRKNYCEDPAIASSFFFVFNCYTYAYGIMFPDFFNVTMYLPFIIIGIDSVFNVMTDHKDKRDRTFIILGIAAIFLHSLTGFYFIYMEMLFSGFYILYKLFVIKEISIINKIKTCVYLALYFFIGIILSAFIFIPELKLYFASSRAESSNIGIQSFVSLFSGKALLARISSLGIGIWGIGLGICIVGVICVIVLFTEKGNLSLKIATALTIAAYFNRATGSITNGFSYSVDRYIFMVYFVLGIIVCHGLQEIERINIIHCISAICFILAVSFAHYNSNTDWPQYLKIRCIIYAVISVAFVVVLKLGDVFIKNHVAHVKFYSVICMLSIAIVSIAYSANKTVGGMEWTSMFLSFSEVSDRINYSNYGKAAYQLGSGDENDFARLDIGETSLGASFFTDTNSTTVYLSMIEPSYHDFLTEYGVSSSVKSSFILQKLDGRANMEMLLSIKKYTDGDHSEILSNDYCLPMGVLFDSYIPATRSADYTLLEKNALLGKTVILDGVAENVAPYDKNEVSELIEQVPIKVSYDNIIVEDGAISVTDQSNILVDVGQDADADSEYYLCIHDFISLSGTHDISIADKLVRLQGTYIDANQDGNVYVKIPDIYVKDGLVPVKFNESGRYSFSEITVERFNLKSLPNDYHKLQENTLQNMKFDGKKLTGTISTDFPGILFMSIPYSPKWKCYIDGVEAKIFKADTGFSAVELSTGGHDVRFEYYYFK
jgi:uncharacterized membrane protein YfhO